MIKDHFELDDFIIENSEVAREVRINPETKLANFAKIKIAAIDPKIHKEISDALKRIEKNLEKLKKSVQI